MASSANTPISADPARDGVAPQHRLWRSLAGLSSRFNGLLQPVAALERGLESAEFDRAPWLAVGFGSGIGLWFALDNRWEWLGLMAACLGLAVAATALRAWGKFPFLRIAILSMTLMVAAGCATVWLKSTVVGAPPISYPMAPFLVGRVLDRVDEPAEGRLHLLLATHEPRSSRVIRVQVTLPVAADRPGLAEGAIVALRARLMPPAAPTLPGSYDFARAAWFNGVAGTGSIIGEPQIVVAPARGQWVARARHALAAHVRARIAKFPGGGVSEQGIAAVFVTGERGGIAPVDAQAMRDAGLAHLLAVSGLHVSAVIGLAYLLTIRLLALVPALALRLRLPLVAAGVGALVGFAYTLLTGSQLGTMRSWVGALLVLVALALGRQPLSLRLLAAAAMVVMLLWPEAVAGASFQMSFGSVLAIIALHDAQPLRDFLARRAEPWLWRAGRKMVMLLITGVVIDLALMPVALFHFHRAGLYGAVANLVAIPLTMFVSMPLLAISLALDGVGLGGPAWWLTGKSLELLLAIAHWTANRPGAVTTLPSLGEGRYLVFVAAMLWLGLWRGRVRLLALVPAVAATLSLLWLRPPDVMITGDGRNLGIVADSGDRLMILRQGRSSFDRGTMLETAGLSDDTTREAGAIPANITPLTVWPGTRCNHDFCVITLNRGGRIWRMLVARTQAIPADRDLAAACAGVDIVIAQQKLLGPCHPALIKADRTLLMRTGGVALDLVNRQVTTVAAGEGDHPWWRGAHRPELENNDEAPVPVVVPVSDSNSVVPGPGLLN